MQIMRVSCFWLMLSAAKIGVRVACGEETQVGDLTSIGASDSGKLRDWARGPWEGP